MRRQCYNKYWRCPGWSGGGFRTPRRDRCDGGSLLVPGICKNGVEVPWDRWWKWKTYRCREDCGVIALPYVTRYIDPTWWAWRVRQKIRQIEGGE